MMTMVMLVMLIIVMNVSGFFLKTSMRRLLPLNVLVQNTDDNKETEIEAGSPLSLAAVRTDLRLSFQCKAGHCRSCEMYLNNKIVLTCQTKVPKAKSVKIKRVKKKR